jgi:hypothetical protein
MKKMDLFGWFSNKEQQFSLEQIKELVEKIKIFNAGAIDHLLTKHVDEVFQKWVEQNKKVK